MKDIFRSVILVSLKRKECILPMITYVSETLTFIRTTVHKVVKRAIEQIMYGVSLYDRIPNLIIHKRCFRKNSYVKTELGWSCSEDDQWKRKI